MLLSMFLTICFLVIVHKTSNKTLDICTNSFNCRLILHSNFTKLIKINAQYEQNTI